MRLIGKSKLHKRKGKNIGNKLLCSEIDDLLHVLKTIIGRMELN